MMVLDTYSSETEKTATTCFNYERPYGPPESTTAKYYVYRVPAGIYAAGLDCRRRKMPESVARSSGKGLIGTPRSFPSTRIGIWRSYYGHSRFVLHRIMPLSMLPQPRYAADI